MRLGLIAASAFVKSPSLVSIRRGIAIKKDVAFHCAGKDWSENGGGVSMGNGVIIGPCCVINGADGIHRGIR